MPGDRPDSLAERPDTVGAAGKEAVASGQRAPAGEVVGVPNGGSAGRLHLDTVGATAARRRFTQGWGIFR